MNKPSKCITAQQDSIKKNIIRPILIWVKINKIL